MKKSNKKASMNWLALLALIVVGVLIAGAAFAGIAGFAKGTFSTSKNNENGEFSYAGKNVELKLEAQNTYTAANIDPTYYIYKEKPANWDNGRVSLEDGYISSESSASGSAVLAEVPGTYYVRAILSTYYDEFIEVVVPASGDVPLSQYNDGGEEIVKVPMIDVEALSTSNQDMGIATNETSDKTYHVFANFNIDDNEGFCLDEVKIREDATYSFAEDTDGDGIYDEGVNKIVVTVDGKKTTVFDVAGSINEFSGDNEAIIPVANKLFPENDVLAMKFEVTCDLTLDAVGDADEKCGDGEDFLDDVILVDCAGNTATFHLVG